MFKTKKKMSIALVYENSVSIEKSMFQMIIILAILKIFSLNAKTAKLQRMKCHYKT
jgi:hypothetical protein